MLRSSKRQSLVTVTIYQPEYVSLGKNARLPFAFNQDRADLAIHHYGQRPRYVRTLRYKYRIV